MAVMIQNRNVINPNIRNIFSYLNKQFKNYGFDEAEEDIRMGLTSIEDELYNEQLNSSWQNKYSQNCIFMYKPVTEIE